MPDKSPLERLALQIEESSGSARLSSEAACMASPKYRKILRKNGLSAYSGAAWAGRYGLELTTKLDDAVTLLTQEFPGFAFNASNLHEVSRVQLIPPGEGWAPLYGSCRFGEEPGRTARALTAAIIRICDAANKNREFAASFNYTSPPFDCSESTPISDTSKYRVTAIDLAAGLSLTAKLMQSSGIWWEMRGEEVKPPVCAGWAKGNPDLGKPIDANALEEACRAIKPDSSKKEKARRFLFNRWLDK